MFCLGQVLAQVPQDSLLLYYSFSGNALDSSGNGFHGTVNGPTLVPDRFGNPNSAYFFDGVNDFIELPNVSDLKPDLSVSFSFWAKLKSLNQLDNQFFSTSASSHYSGCTFNTTSSGSGGLNVNFYDNLGGSGSNNRRTKTGAVGFAINEWYHIVGIINGATDMEIYVNGVLFSGYHSGSGGNLGYSSIAGAIGKTRPSGAFHWGTIDDFAYYNKALTYCEVQMLYGSEVYETVDEIEVCDSLVWIDGNTYFTNNNTASYAYTSANGCDSVVFLDLSIIEINDSISVVGSQLSVDYNSGATYQWYKCSDVLTPISGANLNTYQVVTTGQYAVEINYLGCQVTSDCISVKSVGVNDFENEDISYNINTKDHLIEVEIENVNENYQIEIFDVLGNLMSSDKIFPNAKLSVSTISFPKGVYFISAKSKSNHLVKKCYLP